MIRHKALPIIIHAPVLEGRVIVVPKYRRPPYPRPPKALQRLDNSNSLIVLRGILCDVVRRQLIPAQHDQIDVRFVTQYPPDGSDALAILFGTPIGPRILPEVQVRELDDFEYWSAR